MLKYCYRFLHNRRENTMENQKSKMVAGLLGIFLGAYGIHNFYLGNTKKAVIQIIVSVLTCGIGGLWGFIEGIMILMGKINVDANGVPLKD
ncbi:MAG: TM2 domain-containing protein [Lachnospira sp.]|nr:TM2 domain-containing protein [Lachnospira sp.]